MRSSLHKVRLITRNLVCLATRFRCVERCIVFQIKLEVVVYILFNKNHLHAGVVSLTKPLLEKFILSAVRINEIAYINFQPTYICFAPPSGIIFFCLCVHSFLRSYVVRLSRFNFCACL